MTKQAGWTDTHLADDLKTWVSRSFVSAQREIAQYTAVLSNRVNTVKASGLEALPVSKTEIREEVPKSDGNCKDINSGTDSSSGWRSKS